jgi:spore maturation protein CgeB
VSRALDIVFIGLAITSSWGNGHATTYRSLLKGLQRRGHRVTFLERDQAWYAQHRDAPALSYCATHLYADEQDLRERFSNTIRQADAVIVGSYVCGGRDVIRWVLDEAIGVRAFYDIDTPVTLAKLENDSCDYLGRSQIAQFDLMLSFTGGPVLQRLEDTYGARMAVPLYCSVDTERYRDLHIVRDIDLGYMGTYSADRQDGLEHLLNEPARQLRDRKFSVVGAQYPATLCWPANVERIEHLAPQQHPNFYSRQRFTLNLTRADMREAGHSPSVRLFEAAACGTPIISDRWAGLTDLFVADEEILIADRSTHVIDYLENIGAVAARRMAAAARERVLASHTGDRRPEELEFWITHAASRSAFSSRASMPASTSRSPLAASRGV